MGKKLIQIVDPIVYKKILQMPKYIVSATGDEFFVPDSSEFFYKYLDGEKLLRYVPNVNQIFSQHSQTSHSLGDSDAMFSLLSFYHSFLNNKARPRFSWTNKYGETHGILTVKTIDRPSVVRLWIAVNENSRDFRLVTIGKVWKSIILQDQGQGTFIGKVETPKKGYAAYLLELKYPSGIITPMTFTTSTFIVPNKFPCEPPQ
jgi:PhoPQ-activated pathogenicity-related protein